jgi:hypothetical protein
LGCDYGLHGFHIWYGQDNQRKEISMSKKILDGYGWAWVVWIRGNTWGICHWVYSSKEQLLKSKKPSPEAFPRRVKIQPITKPKDAE